MSIIFQFVYIERTFVSKGLTIAVSILFRNWPTNIEVLIIWVNVGTMSRHLSRKYIGMGSKVQEVGLELFIIASNCVIVTG